MPPGRLGHKWEPSGWDCRVLLPLSRTRPPSSSPTVGFHVGFCSLKSFCCEYRKEGREGRRKRKEGRKGGRKEERKEVGQTKLNFKLN